MWKILFKILAIIILVIFQISFFSKFIILGVIPDIVLIVAICFVLKGNFPDGLLIAGIGGLLLDVGSSMYFGFYTIIFLSIILMINFLIRRVAESPNLLFLFVIFWASFLFFNFLLAIFIKHWPTPPILWQSAMNGLWGLVGYWLLGKTLPSKEETQVA